MADQSHLPAIEMDIAMSKKAGITGTPSFVLASYDGGTSIKGRKLVGAQPYSKFQVLLEEQLEARGGSGLIGSQSENFQLRGNVASDSDVQ